MISVGRICIDVTPEIVYTDGVRIKKEIWECPKRPDYAEWVKQSLVDAPSRKKKMKIPKPPKNDRRCRFPQTAKRSRK
jgi:hypothetical protein